MKYTLKHTTAFVGRLESNGFCHRARSRSPGHLKLPRKMGRVGDTRPETPGGSGFSAFGEADVRVFWFSFFVAKG